MSAPSVPLDQVEWRVDSEPYERSGRTVCRFVPYLNAPIVARLLDEWVGPDGWSDDYEVGTLGGKEVLWCSLTIGEVTKRDVGMPSNTEAQKGQVSDAFKRAACLKWGVGRNVYDLPTLFAVCGARENRNGKKVAFAVDGTLPDLLKQLKARGFDADGGRVLDAEPDEDRAGEESASLPSSPDSSPAPLADRATGEVLDVDGMKLRDLVDALNVRGLVSEGSVPELRERLREAVAA